MLVHIIADYGYGDLAFAEVVQRLKLHLPEAEPLLTPVPAFSTLAAGFCIAQLGLNESPTGTIIYHNVAPRLDDSQARIDNAGERLAFARLPTGVRVIGVNAGYTFAFVRDVAEELRWTAAATAGSQFRSRDLFLPVLSAIVQRDPAALGDEISQGDIPEIPLDRIAYCDGYGNLKTTISARSFMIQSGTQLWVRIGEKEHLAIVTDKSFAVAPGQLAFAQGSSGWKTKDGEETQWMELFLRGGSASAAFHYPQVGSNIHLSSHKTMSDRIP